MTAEDELKHETAVQSLAAVLEVAVSTAKHWGGWQLLRGAAERSCCLVSGRAQSAPLVPQHYEGELCEDDDVLLLVLRS